MRGGLVGAVAVVLGLLLPGAGTAHADADPVDVQARMYPDGDVVRAGASFGLRVIAETVQGRVPGLAIDVTLPEGVGFEGNIDDATSGECVASGVRTLRCSGDPKLVSSYVKLRVGAGVAAGTPLVFTATADLGGAVDSAPQDNTVTRTVTVKEPADTGVAWTSVPAGPVPPGAKARAVATLTNHGPGAVRLDAVSFWVGYDAVVALPEGKGCWTDPGIVVCDIFRELAPGEAISYPLTWTFPETAAGTTYKVTAGIYSANPLDPNPANDSAQLVIRIGKGGEPSGPAGTPSSVPSSVPSGVPSVVPSSSATPTATPTGSPAPAPSVTSSVTSPVALPQGGSGGRLADTGAGGPLVVLGIGAGALVCAGGVLLLSRRLKRSG